MIARWLAFAIAAAIILAFVVSGNGSPVLTGRTEHNRAGAAGW